MKREKVTLYFKNGSSMSFKCKNFKIEKNKKEGGYCSASWGKLNEIVSFTIDEVIGVKIKKVLF